MGGEITPVPIYEALESFKKTRTGPYPRDIALACGKFRRKLLGPERFFKKNVSGPQKHFFESGSRKLENTTSFGDFHLFAIRRDLGIIWAIYYIYSKSETWIKAITISSLDDLANSSGWNQSHATHRNLMVRMSSSKIPKDSCLGLLWLVNQGLPRKDLPRNSRL